jgi:hypothetical protein
MPIDYGIEFSSRKEAEEMYAHIIDVLDSQVQSILKALCGVRRDEAAHHLRRHTRIYVGCNSKIKLLAVLDGVGAEIRTSSHANKTDGYDLPAGYVTVRCGFPQSILEGDHFRRETIASCGISYYLLTKGYSGVRHQGNSRIILRSPGGNSRSPSSIW